MFTTSALYKRLALNKRHTKEIKISIAGVEYGQRKISSCAISGGVFKEFTIGECASREISVTVKPPERVPRMARIEVFCRLSLGAEVSEWVPGGVFFVDTRKEDKATKWTVFHGYDAMLKTEQVYFDEGNTGEWPRSAPVVVAEICTRMGVQLDSRSAINPAHMVEFPNDLTMREVLMDIAVAHCGNWRMTGDGELLLVPSFGLPAETRLLVDNADGGAILFGNVRILI